MENARQTGAKMIVVINILHGITTLFLVYLNHSKDMHGLLEIMPYSTYIEIYGIYAVTILFVTTDLTLIFGLVKNSLAIMKIWMVTTWIRNLVSIFTSI